MEGGRRKQLVADQPILPPSCLDNAERFRAFPDQGIAKIWERMVAEWSDGEHSKL
jgi:hypothetical protein